LNILGTDPGEDWSKKVFDEYYHNAVKMGVKGDHTVSSKIFAASSDGNNVVATYNVRFPSLLQNGDTRFSYNWIKTAEGWKCNFLNIAVVPLNN
jgi:hypothetical protein